MNERLHPVMREALAPFVMPRPGPRFENVSCSQCGRDFGPGNHGYSRCSDHALAAEFWMKGRAMAEPSDLNLWTRQWRAERIRKARADFRERDASWQCLKDKSTDYAKSLKMARDVCKQVLELWESSPVDLPAAGVETSEGGKQG